MTTAKKHYLRVGNEHRHRTAEKTAPNVVLHGDSEWNSENDVVAKDSCFRTCSVVEHSDTRGPLSNEGLEQCRKHPEKTPVSNFLMHI